MKKRIYIRPAMQVNIMKVEKLICVSIQAGGAQENVITEAKGSRTQVEELSDEEVLYMLDNETPQNGLW